MDGSREGMKLARKPQQTTSTIRATIDSGAARDKRRFPDPAAAPLGTDDEAAGTPPTAEQLAMAAEAEQRLGLSQSKEPETMPVDKAISRLQRGVRPVTIVLVAAAMIGVIAFAGFLAG